ncbi:MAG: serine hydroxymethyltransferase [bacterium]|nr:serine hydroxymethyltransferase [bacterium]MDZ4296026.1 serine hydroxymethyltransferase [Patescibacteria group bacterium]
MDDTVKKLIKAEAERQSKTLDLIPSENYPSREVRAALATLLTAKYSEGYPGKRYYPGNRVIDDVECLAQERALRLFRLTPTRWHANVQALSGTPANLAAYIATVPLGGTILALALPHGGHLSHGLDVNFSGKLWRFTHYEVDAKTERLDYDAIRRIAVTDKPQLIVCGYTAYPRRIDFKEFRAIADAVGARLMADIAHIAGLVVGGAHPSPFPYADIVTTTTHKTLRGPRGALVICRSDLAQAVDRAVFPGLQGGPHNNTTAAMAVAFAEAGTAQFRAYARQIVKNARALAAELKGNAFRLVSGGTDNHLLLVDLTNKKISGKEAEKLLESAGIIANRNTIPNDPRRPWDPSGLRLGTPALTTRGMKENEMQRIGRWVHELIDLGRAQERVRKEVEALTRKFPIP